MNENPFAPSSTVEPSKLVTFELARSRVRRVAFPMTLVALVSLLVSASVGMYALVNSEPRFDASELLVSPEASGGFVGGLISTASLPFANLLVLLGGISMFRMNSLTNSRVAAIICCTPICSPLIVIGIPIGLWAALILFSKQYSVHFRSR